MICTIHQPSSTVLGLFNKIMILSQGETVFFGTAQEAVSQILKGDSLWGLPWKGACTSCAPSVEALSVEDGPSRTNSNEGSPARPSATAFLLEDVRQQLMQNRRWRERATSSSEPLTAERERASTGAQSRRRL